VNFVDNRCTRVSHGISVINGEATFDNIDVSQSGLVPMSSTVNVGFLNLDLMAKVTVRNSYL
jgi:hypothetical protein